MTCNAMGTLLAENRKIPTSLFDFMLVDEAGTILPSKMIVLGAAKRAMLFGDVKQLKPVFAYNIGFERKAIAHLFNFNESQINLVCDYYSCADNSNNKHYHENRSMNALDIANQSTLFFMPHNRSVLECPYL